MNINNPVNINKTTNTCGKCWKERERGERRKKEEERNRKKILHKCTSELTGFSNLKKIAKNNIKMSAVDLDMVYLSK